MNNYFKNLLVFACILLALSCQKKDNTPADLSKIAVTFITPAAQQLYHKNDTVQINASVTYISEITGVGMQIIDSATDDVLFEDDHDLHTSHYSISESWVDTLSANATLSVVVTVFVANTTGKAERSISFRSLP